jgi:hypothetical protein
MLRICGQSAALLPKSVIVGHGRGSETERKLIPNEDLANLRGFKIQCQPIAKVMGLLK